jgi:hypothetical protein
LGTAKPEQDLLGTFRVGANIDARRRRRRRRRRRDSTSLKRVFTIRPLPWL